MVHETASIYKVNIRISESGIGFSIIPTFCQYPFDKGVLAWFCQLHPHASLDYICYFPPSLIISQSHHPHFLLSISKSGLACSTTLKLTHSVVDASVSLSEGSDIEHQFLPNPLWFWFYPNRQKKKANVEQQPQIRRHQNPAPPPPYCL